MPAYDYVCAANGEVVEVRHGMNERLETWGELCERAGHDPGSTPADSPVTKQFGGGGNLLVKGGAKAPAPAKPRGGHGGGCPCC